MKEKSWKKVGKNLTEMKSKPRTGDICNVSLEVKHVHDGTHLFINFSFTNFCI